MSMTENHIEEDLAKERVAILDPNHPILKKYFGSTYEAIETYNRVEQELKEKHRRDKMNIEEEKYFVCQGMERYGGSFVKALGVALSHADPINTGKIKSIWPEYWEQYLEMGKKAEELK